MRLEMVTIAVQYRLKPGEREKLLQFVMDNVINTRKEKGNLYYVHYPSIENDQDMFVFECWETEEDVNRHNSAPHFLEFAMKRKPMLESYLSTRYESSIIRQHHGMPSWADADPPEQK
ncbi:putative quinol monooxygenase [uncultured Flavonifractor sp.]|uniref:putative quinol monooxygenase n=1 Tax=uncultured Flavonifractor sp. TaxID=1193534 RepID=UPI00262DFC5C|nr:antibiotic biosynthesis monooxygenase [uncultured Flavonifractor sp.]